MGCSFPVAEIKFFIYIKNAGFGEKENPKHTTLHGQEQRVEGQI